MRIVKLILVLLLFAIPTYIPSHLRAWVLFPLLSVTENMVLYVCEGPNAFVFSEYEDCSRPLQVQTDPMFLESVLADK